MSLLAAGSPLLRPDILIATGLMALLLIAGAAAILVAERWKRKAIAPNDLDAQAADDLAEFRTMFERGELTEEEYDKIRQRTAQRLKEDLRIAPPAPPPPSTGPAPPPSLN